MKVTDSHNERIMHKLPKHGEIKQAVREKGGGGGTGGGGSRVRSIGGGRGI